MSYTLDDLKKSVEALKGERDALNVKLHLAKTDLRDEWDKLEAKWEECQGKVSTAKEEAGKAGESILTAGGLLVDEIKKGYERIRNAL